LLKKFSSQYDSIQFMKNKLTCILCSSSQCETIDFVPTTNKAYNPKSMLAHCRICHLYWINPLPDEKKLSQIYGEIYHYNPNKIRDLLFSLPAAVELRSDIKLISQYKKQGKVLDIGAGRGDFLSQFPKKQWERWAWDPFLSDEEIDMLKQKIGEHANDYKTLQEYPQNLFDVVILRNVIEHTAAFPKLLKDTQKILKKNGILFIRTPNIGSLDFRMFGTKWYSIMMAGHLVFFTRQSIDQALTKAGFKTTFTQGTKKSAPMSLARSSSLSMPMPLLLTTSLAYSIISPLFGEGGDLRSIAQK